MLFAFVCVFILSSSMYAYAYVCEQGKDADAGVFILVIYAMPVLSSVIIPVLVEVCNSMAAK